MPGLPLSVGRTERELRSELHGISVFSNWCCRALALVGGAYEITQVLVFIKTTT